MEEKKEGRKIYLDILRILACYLVLLCHTVGFVYDKSNISGGNWFPGVTLYYISKIAVPIFFMISGALMLKKDRSYKEIFKKILFRFLIPLLLVSMVVYFKRTPTLSLDNIYNFFKEFLNEEILLPLWFLYSIIGMYICTPILRKLVKNMEKKDYIFLFVIYSIFSGILPIFSHYTNLKITNYLIIPIIGRYIPYYVLGYYMFEKDGIKTSKKGVIIASILSIVCLVASVVLSYFNVQNTKTVVLDNVDFINLSIPSFAVAYIIKCCFSKVEFSDKIKKIIIAISETTFGVYLIHTVFIGHLQFIYNFLMTYVGKNLGIILHNIVFFSILSLIIFILRKIPYINKII